MDATRALMDENEREISSSPQTFISAEVAVYLALVLLSVVLRVAQLDAVPLSTGEARQALAAWRAVSLEAAGTPIVAESPVLFTLHSFMFTVLGPSEFSARILTALAGVGLVLSPLLFRGLLGRTRTLLFSILLTFSPSLLITSRMDSPVIWTLLVVMFGLWAFWRYRESSESRFAVLTIVCLAAMIFLTDPTGIFLALVLGGAGLFAYWTHPREESDEEQPPQAAPNLSALPWLTGLLMALLVVVVVSTQLLTYPAGLSIVGELLGSGLRGVVTSRPLIPAFFPVLVTLFYEPVLVVLGIGAIWWLRREGLFTTVERFLTGWLLLSVVFGLVYAGAGPEHALWLVLPLAGLVSALAAHLLTRATDIIWWSAPGWSKWLVAGAVVALLSMFAIHSQSLARTLLVTADGTFQLGSSNSISVVWVIIIILFMVIGYFLSSSVWGVGTTTQGGLLGLLAFMLITSLGSGWRVSVFDADDPVQFWNRNPANSEVFLLRDTLAEIAKRNSGGFPMLDVTVLAADDGIVAWTLRNFPHTHFITDAGAAKAQEIVLLPVALANPDLGGPYVGQRFTITSAWDYRGVRLVDLPAWWLQNRSRTGGVPADQMVLWLRQDVYDGVPFTVNQ